MPVNLCRRSRVLLLVTVTLLAALLGSFTGTEAHQTGPLAYFKDNVRQMHIVARYTTTITGLTILANVIQTVTATALRSSPGTGTFWLVEKEHVDPQHFYRQRNVPLNTAIQFLFFVDTVDVAALIQGSQGDSFDIIKMTDHYALVKESRQRNIQELPTVADLQAGESAVIALPEGGGITGVPTFVETPVTIVEAAANAAVFVITFPKEDSESNHGAPVFVQRDNLWKLAGIRVAHGRVSQRERSAVARLPLLDELLRENTRTLDPSEYRLVQAFTGDLELELHNVREPKNARNVQVVVEARVNFIPRAAQETMDISNGKGTKTIRLGRIGEQIDIQRVTIRFR